MFRFQQLGVLDDERVFGFGQDTHKIFLGKGLQLDADRETSLHFRNHVRGFGKMKCTGGNEEDVLGPDWAVFGVDRGTFDNRKQVPLDSFPGNIGSVGLTPTGGNLIHLVEEDDAVFFHPFHCFTGDLFHIDQFSNLFLLQNSPCIRNRNPAVFLFLGHDVREHVTDVHVHVVVHRNRHQFHHRSRSTFCDLEFHHLLFEHSGTQFFPEFFTGGVAFGSLFTLFFFDGRKQQVQQAFLHHRLSLFLFPGHQFLANHVYRIIRKVSDDGFHIPADIAHFRELRGFHLDERGTHQPCDSPCNFSLSHASRPDHDDIFGQDFVPKIIPELKPSPAVSQGNGHCFLGLVLPDDVSIQGRDDLLGGLVGFVGGFFVLHSAGSKLSSSKVIWSLV